MHKQCRCTSTAAFPKVQQGVRGWGASVARRGWKRWCETTLNSPLSGRTSRGLRPAHMLRTSPRGGRFLHPADQGARVFWDGIQQKGWWKGSSPGRLLEEGRAAPGLVGAQPTGGRGGARWPSTRRWLGPRSRGRSGRQPCACPEAGSLLETDLAPGRSEGCCRPAQSTVPRLCLGLTNDSAGSHGLFLDPPGPSHGPWFSPESAPRGLIHKVT